MTTYGYIRTSRRRQEGVPGSDPESQLLELRAAGVQDRYVHRDVGASPGPPGDGGENPFPEPGGGLLVLQRRIQ